MQIWLALEEGTSKGGAAAGGLLHSARTRLACAGNGRLTDQNKGVVAQPDFSSKAKKLQMGRIAQGRQQLIYVEGDRQTVLNNGMTIVDFARTNSGSYLVIVVQLN